MGRTERGTDRVTTPGPSTAMRWLLAAVLLLPLVAAAVSVLGHRWVPTGDIAIIDLRSRDVLSLHPPLTGLFSRRGWNHPGPAMFWILAPFAAAARGTAAVLRIGWILVDAVVLLAASVLAARVSRTLLLVTSLTIGLSYLALPASVHRMPWNPWMPVPMLVLLIVLAVRVGSGRPRDLIGIVVVGSVMVQTHAGVAPVVLGLAALAGVWAVRDARRGSEGLRALRSPAGWCLGVGVLLWLPPTIGAITGAPGNLRILLRYFLDAPDPPLGTARALRIMAAEFAWRPPWLGGPYRVQSLLQLAVGASPLWLVPPVALLIAGSALSRRAGRRDDARLVIAAAVVLLCGVLAISRADIAFPYTFEWRGVVAAFVVVVATVPFVRLLVAREPARIARIATGLAVAVVVATAAVAVPKLARRPIGEDLQPAAGIAVRRAIERGPDLRGRRVLVLDPAGGYPIQALRAGIADAVDAAGGELRMPGAWARATGSERVSGVAAVDEVWSLVVGDGEIADALARPGARLVWRAQPESAEGRRTAELRAQLRQRLIDAGRPELVPSLDQIRLDPRVARVPGIDPRFAALLATRKAAAVRADPCRCALIATPGGRGTR